MKCLLIILLIHHLFGGSKGQTDLLGTVQNIIQYIFQGFYQKSTGDTLETSIKFFLHTKEQTRSGRQIKESTSLMNSSKPVKVLVHGWRETRTTIWYKDLTKALLEKGDYNIIQVDWSELASQLYTLAVPSSKIAGKRIAELIVYLYEKKGIPLSQFHIIGHSLGAHVAGFVGKKIIELTNAKVRLITSLDAAGPLFEVPERPPEEKLSDEDAEIVENLHTDGGALGFNAPVGTIDYFANGGMRSQPGCNLLEITLSLENISLYPTCSHKRSTEYYIKAIQENGIPATRCDSWEAFKNGDCDNNKIILFGGKVSVNDTGLYYFDILDDY